MGKKKHVEVIVGARKVVTWTPDGTSSPSHVKYYLYKKEMGRGLISSRELVSSVIFKNNVSKEMNQLHGLRK